MDQLPHNGGDNLLRAGPATIWYRVNTDTDAWRREPVGILFYFQKVAELPAGHYIEVENRVVEINDAAHAGRVKLKMAHPLQQRYDAITWVEARQSFEDGGFWVTEDHIRRYYRVNGQDPPAGPQQPQQP